MKYIIEVEKIEGINLYKAKGFDTLVFDEKGLSKLEIYEEHKELIEGCTIKTPNGDCLYKFVNFSNDGNLNAINLRNGRFTNLSSNKYIIVDYPNNNLIEKNEVENGKI